MLAFRNDPKIKEEYLFRVKAHALADEIIKGSYWEKGKGCAVGCTIHSADHVLYEIELGIPQILAHLEDRLFERLPNEIAMKWPYRFLESISVGKDLSLVWPKFAIWILVDKDHGVIRFNKSSAITDVADLYQRQINGYMPKIEEWKLAIVDATADASAACAAASAAWASACAAASYADAAASAASAASYADAAASAASAAASAASASAASAASYADAAASAADASAAASYADATATASASAREAYYIKMADKLIELLEEEI